MKLLVAIPSNRPKDLVRNTLRWAPRAGFELRIFADPKTKKSKYQNAIEEANYQHYLALRHKQVEYKLDPLAYAQANGYDLLVIIPPNLKRWNDTKELSAMVIEFQTALAEARKRMRDDTSLSVIDFENGARMVRIVEL
jgi:hypothetical protein